MFSGRILIGRKRLRGTLPVTLKSATSAARHLLVMELVEGEDLGRASVQIAQAIKDAGELPRGVEVRVRGQVAPMTEMFQ